MKKRTFVSGIFTFILIFALTACGKSTKDHYLEALNEAQNYTSGDFHFAFDDLSFSGGDSSVGMIASLIKSMELSGTVAQDDKNTDLDMKIMALGQTIPIHVITTPDETYLAADFVSSILQIAGSFDDNLAGFARVDLSALKGKYISANQAAELSGQEARTQDIDAKTLEDFQKAFMDNMKDFYNKLPESKFTQKDDTITMKLDKGDLADILDIYEKTANSDKRFADFSLEKSDVKKEDIVEAFSKFDLSIAINTKSHEQTVKLAAVAKSDGQEVNVGVTTTFTPNKDKVTVVVPSKSDVVSDEQLQKILSEALGGSDS